MKNLFITALFTFLFSALNACIETQFDNCFNVELERAIEGELFTYTFTVSNTCTNDLSYFAASLPDDEIGLNEYSNTNYELENSTNNPFHSIKFELSNNLEEMIFKFSTYTEMQTVSVALKAGNNTTFFSFENCTSLPVELTDFRGAQQGEEIILNWTTQSETNNFAFDVIELVNNQESFIERVGGNGTTSTENNYTVSVKPTRKGLKYFQIIQIDYDGTETRSEAIAIFFDTIESDIIQIVPNVINRGSEAKLIINGKLSNNLYRVSVTDANGNKIAGFKGLIMNETEQNEIIINNTNQTGIYFVSFYCKGMNPVVKKFFVR